MVDRLLAAVLEIVVALLDRWMDARIAQSSMGGDTKRLAAQIEDELVAFLKGPLGLAVAKAFGKALIAQKFANDPTTGNWG